MAFNYFSNPMITGYSPGTATILLNNGQILLYGTPTGASAREIEFLNILSTYLPAEEVESLGVAASAALYLIVKLLACEQFTSTIVPVKLREFASDVAMEVLLCAGLV